MTRTKFSIEGAFDELEEIIAQLEDPQLGLSDSMTLYKKGVRLLDRCGQTLEKTEKEILILQEEQNGNIHQEHDTAEDE